ncbi:hypothetical protein BY996DRAFT_8403298 [Phakopsora pachyrhizi]|uniref:Uncharacterized protein n=1 Tax=Phakopsora pachyrhizi TaxID=170000 RepID=A0AAV0AGV3_PHAPC|nr:hypothetical protein BY996DRAFT_8403298 [Phakopsora pachyrhizi]CAH7666276.1 hypothetical protein PPACK8108_LOCUS612 [Phakopsora pachyrhizi]
MRVADLKHLFKSVVIQEELSDAYEHIGKRNKFISDITNVKLRSILILNQDEKYECF